MFTSDSTKLDRRKLIPGTYVLVEKKSEKQEKCYEIGITKMTQLQANRKKLKVLILTDASFKELPLKFTEAQPPFLVNPNEEVDLKEYTLYSLDITVPIEFLRKQRTHLKQKVSDATNEQNAFDGLCKFLNELSLPF